jgi:chemotaxis protein histidine kinase CheA
MSDRMDEFEQRFEALRIHYAHQLGERVSEIETIWRKLENGGWEEQLFADLMHRVHGLTGSGATFGFAAVSEISRSLEHALAPITPTGVVLQGSSRHAEVLELIEALRRAVPAPSPNAIRHRNSTRV